MDLFLNSWTLFWFLTINVLTLLLAASYFFVERHNK